MRSLLLIVGGMASLQCLSACSPHGDDKATIDDLRVRVAALEQRQLQMVSELHAAQAKAPLATPPEPAMQFELNGKQYPTEAKCQAARIALIQAQEDQDAQWAARGARDMTPRTYACIPI